MICLNPTCENHQKDLEGSKFCPECGQKTASPEPQNQTCPAAGCANQGKNLAGIKFCPECGSTTVATLARLYSEKQFSNNLGSSTVESNNLHEIHTALEYVIQYKDWCCTTLEIKNSKAWVQVLSHEINCFYPNKENPINLYPDLFNQPIISSLTDFEEEKFMAIELNDWRLEEMASWISKYISKVLNLDLKRVKISHRNENLG